MKENYLIRTSKKHATYFALAKDFIDRMVVYTKIEHKKLMNVGGVKESDDKFTCDGCGKCCDMAVSEMAPDVYQEDLKRWMDEDFGIGLVSLGSAVKGSHGEQCLFIDRKQDFVRKAKFHTPKYTDDIVKINPSVTLVNEKENQQCLFFNSLDNKCSIYATRPIACRAFPYAMDKELKLAAYKKFCPPVTFSKGEIKDWKEIAVIVETTWSNINGLKAWVKNRVGTTIFKETAADPQNKKAVKKATAIAKAKSGQIGILSRFYENIITTFYLLFPEYTKVDEIFKEMNNVQVKSKN
jgi:Fe-S-cluster containining protein